MSGIRGVNATKPGAPVKPERPIVPVRTEKPAAPPAASSSAPGPAPTVQEYVVRVPKTSRKKINVMRFNANLGIDCSKWSQTHVKMERENNMRDFKGIQDDMPKFGAGSEFGREAREEARRKKYGIISKKYKPEDQPWLMRIGGKSGKRFKGTREGGVTENASYYVFTQAPDGAFEAYPVSEWYNFQPIQRFKALSAEEAEEEFGRRNKIFNYFSVMVRKRLKADDGEEEEDGEGGKPKGKKKGGDLGNDGDEKDGSASSDENDGNSDEEGGGKSKKKAGKKKPKKKKDSDDEANEDSDDGDEEGREVDYMSSSESEDDVLDDTKLGLKGVAEEDALRKLLNSDEESEDEEKKENEEEEQEEDPDAAANKAEKEDKADGKKKNKKDKTPRKNDYGSSDSDMGSSDSEEEKLTKSKANKAADASPNKQDSPGKLTESQAEKRKGEPLTAAQSAIQAAKKARMDGPSTSSLSPLPAGATEGVTEESVRRYLARKPMTTTELLQKFKSKKTGLTSEQMVHHVAQILKRINPTRQTIKGKMYLSLKS